MGRRGPKRSTPETQKFKGNPAKKPIPDAVRATGKAKMPAWLDAKAKTVWKRIVPQLEEMGILAAIDADAVARYCTYVVLWRDAQIEVFDKGAVYMNDKGNPTANPAVWVLNAADKVCRDYEKCFGMDPTSRTNLKVSHPETHENPLEELKLVAM